MWTSHAYFMIIYLKCCTNVSVNFTLWDSHKNLGRSAAQQLAAGNFIRGQGEAQRGQGTSKVPKLKSRVHRLIVRYPHSMPACWCQHPHLGHPSPNFFFVRAQWLTERGEKEVWENISFLRILIYLGEQNGLGHRSSFVSGILLPEAISCPKMMHHFFLFFFFKQNCSYTRHRQASVAWTILNLALALWLKWQWHYNHGSWCVHEDSDENFLIFFLGPIAQ